MGQDLFAGSKAAHELFETADSVLGYSISERCFEGPEETLRATETAQPAIFTVSLACLAAAREFGSISEGQPAFLAGHSLGEYTALAAAGALQFDDGLHLVQERGRLMQQAGDERPGAMAAIVGLDGEAVRTICDEAGAEICNLNAPGQVVIGGTVRAVEAAMALALERGARRGVRLKVSGAFHTSLMQPATEALASAVNDTDLRDPDAPVIANTTGLPMTNAADVRSELLQQIAKPVLWQQSVERMASLGVASVIEFGPGRVLSGLVRRIDRSISVRNVSDLATASSDASPAPSPP